MNKFFKLINSDNLILQTNTVKLVYSENPSLTSKKKRKWLSNVIKMHCRKHVFNEENLNITK